MNADLSATGYSPQNTLEEQKGGRISCVWSQFMEIYVQKDGQQVGPFSVAAIKEEVSAGRLNSTDQAWHEGLDTWQPISGLVELGIEAKIEVQPKKVEAASSSSADLEMDLSAVFAMIDGESLGLREVARQFRTLDYGLLFPIHKLCDPSLLRKKAVRWVLLLGLTPIAIYTAAFEFDLDFREIVWLFEIYFCLFWALYFYNLIKPAGSIWRQALSYSLFTIIIGVPADLLLQNLPVIRNLYAGAGSDSLVIRLLSFIFGVGILEEAVKAAPLIIFGLRKEKIAGVKTGLFLGFISGLGFAASEGVSYSFGAAINVATADSSQTGAFMSLQLLQTIFRFMSGPLLHAVWAGSVGWFIGLASGRTENRWPVVVVGIVFMGVLHGVNDCFAGTWIHLLIAAASILIFMAYMTHQPVLDGLAEERQVPAEAISAEVTPTQP